MTNLLDQIDDVFDPNANYLEQLVGDGKKFADVEALAKGKAASDEHIKNLEREKAILTQDYLKLREEYNAGPKLQEYIDKLEQQRLASSENTLNANEDRKPMFDPKEVESLVSTKIQEYELTRKQEQNFNEVRNRLKTQLGTNFQEKLKTQIEEMGLTEEFVNTMARNHPEGLYRMFGLNQQSNNDMFQSPPSSQRNSSFAPNVKKRDWTFYEEMRKTDPAKYHNPKTQLQIIEDAKDLGEAFGLPVD